MRIEFMVLAACGRAQAAELLTRAFADYLVKVAFTEAGLRQLERTDRVDPAVSCVVRLDGEPVGVALIARRDRECRLAGMAILPAARRSGAGRALMEHLLAAARARGERRMVLEVIEQNPTAVRLYEKMGFGKIRRLVGFAGPAPAGLVPVPELADVGVRDVAGAVARQGGIDWPWQLSAGTIAELPAPAAGHQLEGAWLALLKPPGSVALIRTLVVDGDERREERAARLLLAVMARYPATAWRVSALWPEELGGWFLSAGLVRQEISQWQMARELG